MPSLAPRRQRLVLAICCLSLFIVGLDNTIVNVALPSIQRSLHTSVSGLQWTVDAYTLVLASLLMLAGSTGDRFGRRRTFQIGLAVFALGSLLCSLAPTQGWLIDFRVVQAVGGSMLNPVAMSIISNTFTDQRQRARAVGVWAGVIGLSMALGPIVGGLLVGSVGWRAVFWINIPIAVLAMAMAARFVPESRAEHARRFDPIGQLLVLTTLAALIYAIIEGTDAGWSSPRITGCIAVAVIGLAGLVGYERRRCEPLLDISLFRSAPFAGAAVIAVAAFAALGGFLFLNTIYLQQVRGFSPSQAGWCTVPMAVMTVIFAPMSGRLVGSRGARLPLLIAGAAMTSGGLLATDLTTRTPLAWLLVSYAVFGLGFGMVNAPITNVAISALPRSRTGLAAAIASTSRQVGQAVGVAVVGSVLAAGHDRSASDVTAASRLGWWIVTGCGGLVLLVGILSTHHDPSRVR